MLLTVTEYRRLSRDDNGNVVPLPMEKIASKGLSAEGSVTLNATTRFIRIATDTSVQCDMSGGETDKDSELVLAGTYEYFVARGGSTLDFETAPAT